MKRKLFLPFVFLFAFTILSCDDDCPTLLRSDNNNYPEGRLYVLNQADDTIEVWDSKTLKQLELFSSVVDEPHFITFSPDGQYYYVVSRVDRTAGGGYLAKFRTSDNSLVTTVNTHVFPTALRIGPGNDTAYVVDFTASKGHIHRYYVAGEQFSFVDSILQAGYQTHDIDQTSDGTIIIAPGYNSDDMVRVNTITGQTSFLNLDTALGQTPGDPNFGIKYGPYGIKIDRKDSLVYFACSKGNDQIRIADFEQFKIVDSIMITVSNTPNPDRNGPTLMEITPDNSHLLVTNYIDNTVMAINTTTHQIARTVEFSTGRPFSVKIAPDGSTIYVSCTGVAPDHGRVYVLDGATFNKVDSIDVGNSPFGIQFRSL